MKVYQVWLILLRGKPSPRLLGTFASRPKAEAFAGKQKLGGVYIIDITEEVVW